MPLTRIYSTIITKSLFVLSLFCLCGQAEAQAQEPKGEIRVVESWRPDITVLGHNVLQHLFEYALDKNDLTPCLALSRKWIDDTTLEIQLRQGVFFHNGEPFDAQAVKFNFEYQRQHNPGRGVQVYMRNLEEIKIVDQHTVRMVLEQPDVMFLDKIITGPISGWAIGAPRYMERLGWGDFLKRPVGTGPFMIEGENKDYRQVPEGEIYATLVANPNYWKKGHPKIRKINFVRYLPQDALSAVIEGRIDLVTSLIPKDTLRVAGGQHSKVVKGRGDITYTWAAINLMSPYTLPLRRIRVREALNCAINKEELMHYAFKGNAVEMIGPLTDRSGVDLSQTKRYEWNIAKARELLKEDGFSDGFKMKLYYQERDYLTALFLQRFYNLLKIDVEITGVPFEWIVEHIMYPNTRDGYSWDNEDWWIMILSTPCYMPESMAGYFEWFFQSKAPARTVPSWLLAPLDKMYRELVGTKERDERFQIYKRANEYIANEALWLFTVAPMGLYGVNKELEFVPQVAQFLYLDYSSVTENHWSLRGKNN